MEFGHAKRAGDPEDRACPPLGIIQKFVFGEATANPVDDVCCLTGSSVGHGEDKLVAPNAANNIGAAKVIAQSSGESDQAPVTGDMAAHIVHFLEAIQITDADTQPAPGFFCPLEFQGQNAIEFAPVGQRGERIGVSFLLQTFLGFLTLRHIGL